MLKLMNSDDVCVGEWVMAVGYLFGFNFIIMVGIVSVKGCNINILKENFVVESFIQIDVVINFGNSGGVFVNFNGGFVGINMVIVSFIGVYVGYGFVVFGNIVSKVVEDLL